MKKLLSVLMVAALCLGLLAACNNSTPGSESPAAPAATGETSGTPAAPPQEPSTVPQAPSGVPQGYIGDDVDHYARDAYKIAFLSQDAYQIQLSWFSGVQAFEKKLNFTVEMFSADSDREKMISIIELAAMQGFDGFIVACMPDILDRASEVLYDTGIPWIGFANTFIVDGKTVAPNVTLNQYDCGRKCMEWMIENAESYWGVDPSTLGSKLGMVDVTYSVSEDFIARQNGSVDLFKSSFPNSTAFPTDVVALGLAGPAVISAEAAYDLVAATVSANPEIEYWLVTGGAETYSIGAARALENAGKTTANALVCTVGHPAVIADWESMSPDTMTVNVACLATPDLLYGSPAAAGIVAILDGRTTMDTIWLEVTPPDYMWGTDFGLWEAETHVVTRENYQEYFANIETTMLG